MFMLQQENFMHKFDFNDTYFHGSIEKISVDK